MEKSFRDKDSSKHRRLGEYGAVVGCAAENEHKTRLTNENAILYLRMRQQR